MTQISVFFAQIGWNYSAKPSMTKEKYWNPVGSSTFPVNVDCVLAYFMNFMAFLPFTTT